MLAAESTNTLFPQCDSFFDNISQCSVHSETGNAELTFEPGWLHRYPATAALTTTSSETQQSNPSVALPSFVQADNGPPASGVGRGNGLYKTDSSADGATGYF